MNIYAYLLSSLLANHLKYAIPVYAMLALQILKGLMLANSV